MFDIGFFELLIIAVVGLFVIGPERLPGAIKSCALWFGRIKRNLLETRTEIERQLGADEIRQILRNEQVLRNLEKMKDTRAELEAKLKKWEQGETIEQKAEAPSTGEAEGAQAIAQPNQDGEEAAGTIAAQDTHADSATSPEDAAATATQNATPEGETDDSATPPSEHHRQ